MGRFLLRRLAALVGVLFAATIVVFLVLALVPGDPATLMLGQDATPERVRALRIELGLDRPLWEQYVRFVVGALQGDLGRSYQQGRPVTGELMRAFPVTLALASVALALATVVGGVLGILSAMRANTWIDGVLRVVLLSFGSLPVFVLGLFLIYAFAVNWQMLPAFGWGTPQQAILPALTLATFPLASIGRLTRASMLDALGQDHLTTARAKGLRERVVLTRHALRNALIPIVTVIALQFGVLLAGAVLTESIFAVPGMGLLLLNAVFSRDYTLIRGTVLLAAVVVATLSLVVDVLYVALDPRIRRAWVRRFAQDRTAVVALVVLAVLSVLAIIGPFLVAADPSQQELTLRRTPPSGEHWLGMDHLGRDILARLAYGARITLLASGGATLLISVAGLLAGVVSGYYGGWVDQLLMRIADVMLAFPFFLAAIMVVAVLGPDLRNAVLAVAIAKIPSYARIVRSVVLQAREMLYTEAARSLGCTDVRIMTRHIVPNVILPAVVLSTTEMASVVISLAGLSFIGLGAQPPASEWGLMLSEAKGYLSSAPHMLLFPGIALAVLVLSINLAGDGLRYAIDPRSRR